MSPWIRYAIAFVVFCHGFIYVRIGSTLPGPIKGWRGTSWLLAGALSGDSLKQAVVFLHVVAGIAILACALAMAFAPLVPGWWRPLGIAGAAIGIVAFAVFWDGQGQRLFEEGGIGAVVSLLLLVGAIVSPRAFELRTLV